MEDRIKDAYFAGLIDGEGHIGLQKRKYNSLRPTVEVKMTCKKTLEALAEHFGGTVIARKVGGNARWKPQWRWRVQSRLAKEAIAKIRAIR